MRVAFFCFDLTEAPAAIAAALGGTQMTTSCTALWGRSCGGTKALCIHWSWCSICLHIFSLPLQSQMGTGYGQSASFILKNTQGEVVKSFTVNAKPDSPKNVSIKRISNTLNLTWNKTNGAKKYRVTIKPQVGKQIVLITTDPNISVDVASGAKVNIEIAAIGTNGLVSNVFKKTFLRN